MGGMAMGIRIALAIAFPVFGAITLRSWRAGTELTWRGGKVPMSDTSKLAFAVGCFAIATCLIFLNTAIATIASVVFLLGWVVAMIGGFLDHKRWKSEQESKRRTKEELRTEK
jgi:hypothetical protein